MNCRLFGATALVVALALTGCTGGPSLPPASTIPASAAADAPAAPTDPTVLATGLETPWGLAFLSDGSALVSERRSDEILRVSPSGEITSVGRVDGLALDTDEGGLLGLAVPPGREDVVYAYVTTESDNRVVRMSFDGARLGAAEPVVTGIEKGRNHNGGQLLFDADGYLFVSTGDARRPELAQDLDSLNGKILRVDEDGDSAPGNPFGTAVYSYGHRNIQGLAFDSDGVLWATEFGEDTSDELNRIEPGSDYGWPTVEGASDDGRFAAPFVTWSPTSTASPSGLAIVDDVAYIGAHRGRSLFVVALTGGYAGETFRYFTDEFGRIRSVGLAPDGSLWIFTTNRDGYLEPGPDDDRIIRLTL